MAKCDIAFAEDAAGAVDAVAKSGAPVTDGLMHAGGILKASFCGWRTQV